MAEALSVGLVGRDAELGQLSRGLAKTKRESVANRTRLIGTPGIGKTALAREISERAASDGWFTAFIAAHRIQAALPFIAARKLVNAIVEALGSDAQRYTSGLENEISAAAGVRPDKDAVEAALLRLLEALSLDRCILLILDDAQWIDAESRTLIDRILQLLADRQVFLLTTERGDFKSNGSLDHAEETILVEELSDDAIRTLARQLMPGILDDVVEAIIAHARGRALDVVSLASSVSDPSQVTEREVQATMRAIIAKDIATVDPDTRTFLQICSLISEPIDYALLKQLWPDEQQLLALIEKSSGRYLVQTNDSLHFVHTALAQSIQETVAIEIPYRKRIMDALERLPSKRLEDYERLVDQATASGDRTLEKHYLTRLLDEGEKLQVRPVVASALERIVAITPFSPKESLALYSRLSMVYNSLARDNDARRICSEALGLALASGIREGLGQLVVSELFALFFRGETAAFARMLERFEGYLETPEDRAHLFAAKLFASLCAHDSATFLSVRKAFDDLGVTNGLFEVRYDAFNAWRLASLGDFASSTASLDRATARAAELSPLLSVMTAEINVQIRFQQFGPGHPLVTAALASLPETHDARTYLSAATHLANGYMSDVVQVVNEGLVHFDGTLVRRWLLGLSASAAALSSFSLPASLRRAVADEAMVSLRDHVSAGLLPIAASYAALTASESPDQSRAQLRSVVAALREAPPPPMILFFPLILVYAARSAKDKEILEEIADGRLLHDKTPWNIAHGELARLSAAAALGRVLDGTAVNATATQFENLGAPFFASTARELKSAPAAKSMSDTQRLTRREQEVAALVTDGNTNREIAEKLVLSERTVEAHIANIFSKLGTSSRAQLAAWYARSSSAM